jgi:hypothetical protein
MKYTTHDTVARSLHRLGWRTAGPFFLLYTRALCPFLLGPRDVSCVLAVHLFFGSLASLTVPFPSFPRAQGTFGGPQESWKVNRVLANQKTEKHREYTVPCNIPFAWFLMKGYNRQDRDFIR